MAHHNERLIRFCLEKCYPDGVITVEKLISDNLINGTQCAEIAVCRTNPILEICPIGVGRDLTDDSDVKTITVNEITAKTWLKKNKIRTGEFNTRIRQRGVVSEIKNKIGKLRVICYNPFSERWHFFIIPNEAFVGLKKISIEFDRSTQEPNGSYKKYEVSSWDDVCKL